MSDHADKPTTAGRIGGYAPGDYHCSCARCGEAFMGDKRAISCERCARTQTTEPLSDPTGTLATIRWLPIDQYEMDGKDVLLRWRFGYVARGSGKHGRASRDNMPLDGYELPRVEGHRPIMFARLPLEDGLQ